MPSEYLLRPLRLLREACRDITAAHPELRGRDCDTCTHNKLCGIDEQTESASLKLGGHSLTVSARKTRLQSSTLCGIEPLVAIDWLDSDPCSTERLFRDT
jgi:hypothetical protein